MTLQEKIQADLKVAMLARQTEKVSLLRVMLGEFSRLNKEVSDEQVVKILKKMSENATELGNTDEISILGEYMPKSLSKEDLIIAIDNIIKEGNITSIKEMGKIMQELKKLNVPYDGKVASEIIKTKF